MTATSMYVYLMSIRGDHWSASSTSIRKRKRKTYWCNTALRVIYNYSLIRNHTTTPIIELCCDRYDLL